MSGERRIFIIWFMSLDKIIITTIHEKLLALAEAFVASNAMKCLKIINKGSKATPWQKKFSTVARKTFP